VLQCVAVYCSVLQCVTCCSVLQCELSPDAGADLGVRCAATTMTEISVLQGVLQCVAVCCNVLQFLCHCYDINECVAGFVAVCCSVSAVCCIVCCRVCCNGCFLHFLKTKQLFYILLLQTAFVYILLIQPIEDRVAQHLEIISKKK